MPYTVRPMESSDWGSVVEIYYQAVSSGISTFSIECPSYDTWDKTHIAGCRFVAELDGEIVGWAALKPFSERECFKGVAEDSVYIDTNHFRKGVGQALLQAVLEASEELGFWTIQAHIFQNNEASVRLHEKCGFRTVGVRERIAKDRIGMWRSTVLMEHRITKDAAGGCDCDMVKALQAEKAE